MTTYRIRDIQANPFRHIDRYPIRKDKVAALRESLRTTGFWDNVVARIGAKGKPEIAYGHHRLFALQEEYRPTHEVNLIIRDLSDDAMLKIMARENMEEWGTSAAVEHETVRAVVEAYAEGRINLPVPGQPARYAPSFIEGSSLTGRLVNKDHPYSAQTIGEFLGWLEPSGRAKSKVGYALAALSFIEEGTLTETQFDGLTTEQARVVVEQARKSRAASEARARTERDAAEREKRAADEAERRRYAAEEERRRHAAAAAKARDDESRRRAERDAAEADRRAAAAKRERQDAERRGAEAERQATEARKRGQQQASRTGRHVSAGLKSGHGTKDAGKLAEEVRDKNTPQVPDIDKYALGLAAKVGRILDADYDDRAKELNVLLRFHSEMKASSLRELLLALARVAERANQYRDKLGGAVAAETIDAEVIDDRPALASGRKAT